MILYKDLQHVDDDPAGWRCYFLYELVWRKFEPYDPVGGVEEAGDEYEGRGHGEEDLHSVRVVDSPGDLDQVQVDLPL